MVLVCFYSKWILINLLLLQEDSQWEDQQWPTHSQSQDWQNIDDNTGGGKFPCESCNRIFDNGIDLQNHRQLCDKSTGIVKKQEIQYFPPQDKYTCPKCFDVLQTRVELELHFAKFHFNSEIKPDIKNIKIENRGNSSKSLKGCFICKIPKFEDPLEFEAHHIQHIKERSIVVVLNRLEEETIEALTVNQSVKKKRGRKSNFRKEAEATAIGSLKLTLKISHEAKKGKGRRKRTVEIVGSEGMNPSPVQGTTHSLRARARNKNYSEDEDTESNGSNSSENFNGPGRDSYQPQFESFTGNWYDDYDSGSRIGAAMAGAGTSESEENASWPDGPSTEGITDLNCGPNNSRPNPNNDSDNASDGLFSQEVLGNDSNNGEQTQGSFEELCLNDTYNPQSHQSDEHDSQHSQDSNQGQNSNQGDRSDGDLLLSDFEYLNARPHSNGSHMSNSPRSDGGTSMANSRGSNTSTPTSMGQPTPPPSDTSFRALAASPQSPVSGQSSPLVSPNLQQQQQNNTQMSGGQNDQQQQPEGTDSPRLTIASNLMAPASSNSGMTNGMNMVSGYGQQWSQPVPSTNSSSFGNYGTTEMQSTGMRPILPSGMPVSYRPSPPARIRGRPPLTGNVGRPSLHQTMMRGPGRPPGSTGLPPPLMPAPGGRGQRGGQHMYGGRGNLQHGRGQVMQNTGIRAQQSGRGIQSGRGQMLQQTGRGQMLQQSGRGQMLHSGRGQVFQNSGRGQVLQNSGRGQVMQHSGGRGQMIQGGQKRPAPSSGTQSPSKSTRREDINVPSRQKDNECQIIAVANRGDGLPVIANVQGGNNKDGKDTSRDSPNNAPTTSSESTIHLSDSITLSVRSSGSTKESSRSEKNGPDAGVVANLLASRGITVSPAAGEKSDGGSSSNSKEERRLPTADELNLSSAISVHPPTSRDRDGFAVPQAPAASSRSSSSNNSSSSSSSNSSSNNNNNNNNSSSSNSSSNSKDVERPPRPPTVDLTQDVSSSGSQGIRQSCSQCDRTFPSAALLADHQKVHQQQSSSRMPFKCHLCTAGFSTQKGQQNHYQNLHQLHLSAGDVAIPVVDLRNSVNVQRMAALGVRQFLPLNNLQNRGAGGVIGIPLLTLENIRNGHMTLQQWGVSDVLSLGPAKTLNVPR